MSLQKPRAHDVLDCSFRLEKTSGFKFVTGLDEAGRGPLAGPVVSAAVCFSPQIWNSSDSHLLQIKDSKKLSEKKREELYDWIYQFADWVEVAMIDEKAIDRMNILQASLLAFQITLEEAKKKSKPIDLVLVDGNQRIPHISLRQQTVVRGDGICRSIAAASIVAKVTRDRWMCQAAKEFPQYQFEKHKGYGTKIHWAALEEHGPCRIHRRSFLKRLYKKQIGNSSEKRVEDCLSQKGYRILERNWRYSKGEIDVIARSGKELRFGEVRFRADGAIDRAFSETKQHQFRKTVQAYLARHSMQTSGVTPHCDFFLVSKSRVKAYWDVFSF